MDGRANKTETTGGRATLMTIADAVGVSRTTVSNAYSRPDQLTPELREKIFAAAKAAGYAGPSPAGRALRRGRSGAIGLVLTETLTYAVTDPAALLLLRGMAEATEGAGAGLLLLPAPPAGRADAMAVREGVLDAFVAYSLPDGDPRLGAMLARRLPTVIVDEPRSAEAAYVGIDDRAAARSVAEHLVGLGHRRFAVIAFPLAEDDSSGPAGPERQAAATYRISRARLAGFADALRAAGVPWEEVRVEERPVTGRASGYDAAAAILDRGPRPTAILCFADQMALGALAAARERGLGVPEAVSIAGFDDVPEAATAVPALTTVRQPLLEKGRTAGRLVLEGWSGAPPVVLLPTELVVRASTGPVPP